MSLLPAANDVLKELGFAYIGASTKDADRYVCPEPYYELRAQHQERSKYRNYSGLELLHKTAPEDYFGFLGGRVRQETMLEDVLAYLRNTGFPVDAILRTKRLGALLR